MTYEKTSGTSPTGGTMTLRRLGQFSLFFATAGFACPNVFSEHLEVVKPGAVPAIKAETP